MKRFLTVLAILILAELTLFASEISFSGGYTKVSMQQGNKSVTLSGGAKVSTDQVDLSADSMRRFYYGRRWTAYQFCS